MALIYPPRQRLAHLLAAALIAALGTGAAGAEKPEWAGGGKDQGASPPGQMKKADERRGQHAERPRHNQRWDREDNKDQGERRSRDRDRREARDRRAPVIVVQPGSYFNDGQRRHAHKWYGDQYRAGHSPPGLAKKNNGCMPPGQAKKWRVGHALPSGVVYYPVPQPVLVQLGTPPAGYRYVRVANDILLLAIGSRMVVDAITDLGRML